ncbi:hypothetical protein FXW30_01100 [Candidatus Liberibacter asiaticus]|nr:hypothetical protein FXW22_00755 [Candidatus Liberibacter asiaticus]KAE9511276.1 hypothetical protein FXW31_02300 [Candidatus Liberibacter asiaticus]KAE9512636.1 hypothetical protein FXW32_00715 [Candidatus Liberibacter asiaticus]KAE9514930.1 hypothetical protein FXW26_05445 [Candidatus Liberibacter asiaticus]KAE9516883.1 hypothetical protein FXW27_00770 [Candidatus Liberibacter asiaticus]
MDSIKGIKLSVLLFWEKLKFEGKWIVSHIFSVCF